MTVKELIEQLKEQPQDAEVLVHHEDEAEYEPAFVCEGPEDSISIQLNFVSQRY
jgi:hypothetical protein